MIRSLDLIARVLCLFWGSLMLLFGTVDLLVPRARYVSSSPRPAAILDSPPTTVTIAFSAELDPASTISVISTVSLLPSGEPLYSGGRNVTADAGPDPNDPQQSSLRAVLQPGLPNGLYRVDWCALVPRTRAERFGTFYFGVGMPVPAHISRDMPGAIIEQDDYPQGEWSRSAALAAGVLLIALAILLPRPASTPPCPRRSTARLSRRS